jgi:MFS family permease
MVLVIALSAPPAIALAERAGHGFLMAVGALLSVGGIATVAFGGGMPYVLAGMLSIAFGSSAFLAANNSLAAELIPAVHSAKFNGLASLATLAAAALAGLFGPLLDWGASFGNGRGYVVLFAVAAATFLLGTLAARPGLAERPAIGETVTESSRS